MTIPAWSAPTRRTLPIILIRGFGGLGVEDEKRIAYQGFNDGTVYPQKRGENYIYEGLVLRFLKSNWRYQDATNVVGYYPASVTVDPVLPRRLDDQRYGSLKERFEALKQAHFFDGDRVIIDPGMALDLLEGPGNPLCSLWVFRYYDLNDRTFETYGRALVRLIDFIRTLCALKTGAERPKVNIIAHSMGGLIVRQAVQRSYQRVAAEAKMSVSAASQKPETPDECINKIVTLGTPHQGISFQFLQKWIPVGAEDELEHFNPERQKEDKEIGFMGFKDKFALDRLLTVVGTNYRSYNVAPAAWLNRLFAASPETGLAYNRSDGLVQQDLAQIPGAPRTFVHKCHGGPDSLVTSREAYEIATRFFFGNVRARLRLMSAKISRGKDLFGKSEFVFGVSVKPRRVDFDLFHQSAEAENCYGPFNRDTLDDAPKLVAWADPDRLIWEGYLDVRSILQDPDLKVRDMVLRLDFYVGERDLLGIGFSDNVIFRKQYYARAVLAPEIALLLHTNEDFMLPENAPERARGQIVNQKLSPVVQAGKPEGYPMERVAAGWEFTVEGTGFEGRLRIELDAVPETGYPVSLTSESKAAMTSTAASAGVPASPG
jgi:pimeloyl-ACP methyl ester carboxylesterase